MNHNSWEQTRLIIHSCLQPHSKKRLNPKEILPFPWDAKKKKVKRASKEHIQKVLEKYNNLNKEK
tara:strand:- start:1494 stop:1688 length:195 start_codon:yes stop_codon:yes gene_type:complete